MTLPPERARLAARPVLTASPPAATTIGIVAVALRAACAATGLGAKIKSILPHQILRQLGQALVASLSVLDQHGLAFDVAEFAQSG